MKKYIAFLICIIMIFASASVTTAESNAFLSGAVGKNIESSELPADRAYVSYITALMLNSGTREAEDTRFSDVTKDEKYSGYIEFLAECGIINGMGDGTFVPDGAVNAALVSKMALSVLNLTPLADYYDGNYVLLASSLGIDLTAKNSDALTCSEVLDIFYSAVCVEIPAAIYTQDGETFKTGYDRNGAGTYLSSKLGLNIIRGMLLSEHEFYVEKTDKHNTTDYRSESNITVTVDASVDAREYEYVPSTALIDDNANIVYIGKRSNVEIRYETIYAVNGDNRTNTPYSPTYIENIELVNDEEVYDVSDDFTLKFNGAITFGACALSGKNAKIVLQNGEITFIESFDYIRGGLITALDSEEIGYKCGEETRYIKELYKYDNILVYIDGRSSVLGDLKAGSVFDWYAYDKTLCISASEKMLCDNLSGISSDGVIIGDVTYKTDANLKYCVNGKWKTNGHDLMGTIVKAYFAPNGQVAFVEPDDGSIQGAVEFYAIISGVEQKFSLDDEKYEIELYNLNDGAKKEIYAVNKKTRLIGVTMEELSANAKKTDGSGVYFFKLSRNGAVSEISNAEGFYGFDGEIACNPGFAQNATPMFSVSGTTLFAKNTPIIALYETEEGFAAKEIPWSAISGKACITSVYAKFFGRGKCFEPEIAILYGGLSYIGTAGFGIVTDRNVVLADNGEKKTEITVLRGTTRMKYKISNDVAQTIPDYAFISFYSDLAFADDELVLLPGVTPIDLSGRPSSWGSGFWSGTVEKIDSRMIYLTDGRACCFHPTLNFCISVSEGNPNARFKGITIEDIQVGDKVFCNYTVEGIKGIIVED